MTTTTTTADPPDALSASVPPDCLVAARAADAKSGAGTVVLAVGEQLAVTDAFVITSASNVRHVRTLAEEVERAVKAASGRGPTCVEGLNDARWVLLDYGEFVVHVFLDDARTFYDLEHLWAGVPRVPWAA